MDGYDLEPAPEPAAAHAAARNVVVGDVPCSRCGYELNGLPQDGRCPECGAPVRHSLRGNRLEYSADEYLASLHRGAVLIIVGAGLQLCVIVAGIVARTLILGTALARTTDWQVMLRAASVGASLVSVLGWWLFSRPDAAVAGRETGATARRVVRVSVAVAAACAVLSLLIEMWGARLAATGAGGQVRWAFGAALIISLLAFAVQFFASMQYVQWLARRIPNPSVWNRARTLMWLGPVLYLVGALCAMLGPLIATVLYCSMLDWIRRDIRRIRVQRESEDVARFAAATAQCEGFHPGRGADPDAARQRSAP